VLAVEHGPGNVLLWHLWEGLRKHRKMWRTGWDGWLVVGWLAVRLG
jgi:hypothetical protein